MNDNNPNKFLNVVAGLFLIGFIFFVLKELQTILLPLFIAILVSFVLMPLYNLLTDKKIPSGFAIAIVIIVVLLVSNIASLFVFTSVNAFTEGFPRYEQKFTALYDQLILKLNLSSNELKSISESLDIRKLLVNGSLTSTVTSLFSGITAIMGNYILILFYIIFILSESKSIKQRIAIAFSEDRQERLNNTLTDIFTDVKNYLAGKTLLSFIQAVIIGTFLWICGVDFFIIWAFMFFIADFIPNIGSLITTILVAATMLLQFESIAFPAVVVVVLIVIQNLKGNILEPRIFGKRLDLSPLLLFFSLIFWGYLWGIIGMILSVPIMSIIKIIMMNIPAMKPYAILMSNNATAEKVKSV